MSGFASMGGLLTGGIDSILNLAEFIQGRGARDKGYDTLAPIGQQLYDAGNDEAHRLNDVTKGINDTQRTTDMGILSDFANNYFGTDAEGKRNPLGQGGRTGLVRQQADWLMSGLGTRENERVGKDEAAAAEGKQNLADRYASTVQGVKTAYDETTRAADDAFDTVKQQGADALKEARGMRSSDIASVEDQASAATAGISASMAPTLQQAYQGLYQKYAGRDMNDPGVQAQFNQEKEAVRLGYFRTMNTSIGETKAQFSAIRADVATKHALSINSLSSDVVRITGETGAARAGTRASAFSTLTNGLTDAYRTVSEGTLGYDQLVAGSRALRSQIMGSAETNVFGEVAKAIDQDASVLQYVADANRSIEDEFANAERTRETNFSNGVLGAWNAWAQGQSQYANALVNFRSFQSSISDPFWRFADYQTNQAAIAASQDDSFGVSVLGSGFST